MTETEIKHKTKPGVTGYKRWGCRCPECFEAGQAYRDRERLRTREKRSDDGKEPFLHGISGYRRYGCRCEECTLAGKRFLDEKRERDRKVVVDVDWSAVAHLRPGHGVNRPRSKQQQ